MSNIEVIIDRISSFDVLRFYCLIFCGSVLLGVPRGDIQVFVRGDGELPFPSPLLEDV
jgi:hypothetical protein